MNTAGAIGQMNGARPRGPMKLFLVTAAKVPLPRTFSYIISADVMGIGTADQHSSSSFSSQMSMFHISKWQVKSANDMVEYMKTTQVDRVEMYQRSSCSSSSQMSRGAFLVF